MPQATIGDEFAGVYIDQSNSRIEFSASQTRDSRNIIAQKPSDEYIGNKLRGVEIHKSTGPTREGKWIPSANWIEVYGDAIRRATSSGPSNFTGVGGSEAGIHLHDSPGQTRDGVQVNEDYWVEIFGDEVLYQIVGETRIRGNYVPNGVKGKCWLRVQHNNPGASDPLEISARAVNQSNNNILFDTDFGSGYQSIPPQQSVIFMGSETADTAQSLGGDEVEIQIEVNSTPSQTGTMVTNKGLLIETDHVHAPEPGIKQTFEGEQYHPSDCNVIVNGETAATGLGADSGDWRETVDLKNEIVQGNVSPLAEGSVNRVQVTSETLGHLMVYVEGDVFRQTRGKG